MRSVSCCLAIHIWHFTRGFWPPEGDPNTGWPSGLAPLRVNEDHMGHLDNPGGVEWPLRGFSKNSTTFRGSQHSGRLVGSRQGTDRLPKAERRAQLAQAERHTHVCSACAHLRTLFDGKLSCQELHGQTLPPYRLMPSMQCSRGSCCCCCP